MFGSAAFAQACEGERPLTPFEEAARETGFDHPVDPIPEEGKADGVEALGPSVANGAPTEVWAVRNQWTDTDTPEARQAGIAWPANSGLDWEQKYERWIASLEVIPRHGFGQTVRIRTPFGMRSFEAPTLECAEFAIFLRVAFASWYGLPFFLSGWDSRGNRPMFAGHFGFVDQRGQNIAQFPTFRTAFGDFTGRWREGQPWPTDVRLRTLRLGDDDAVPFLSTGGSVRGAGAYFDEIFLNKRVGYFLRLVLLYFGSVNLADGANMYHAKPESLRPGDVLLHRWQRRGIGHVMPILRRRNLDDVRFEVAIASGSMPRRQPLWQEGASARREFLSDYAGSGNRNSEGDLYAALGGGLRRWRTAVLQGGRWRNVVRNSDRANFIDDTDHAAVASRIQRFDMILATPTPEMRRDAALERIRQARAHLSMYPASCSARTRREDAFEELYSVMSEYFGESRASVDARYRTLEDRVFSELAYSEARTSCWNSTTRSMYEIVMRYAEEEQAQAAARGMCVEPTVFRAEAEDLIRGGDGYGRWRAFAERIGRGAEWRAWREDEPCMGRNAMGDRITGRGLERPLCTMQPGGAGCDPAGGNNTIAQATPLPAGGSISARICAGDVDFYRVDAGSTNVTVVVSFAHRRGDLDVQALRADGTVIAESTGSGDEERVTASGTFYVRVYGYQPSVMNDYVIRR
ncbi:MAG: hypothetical protein N2515_02865 [Deltaproteobacteria bacterium]|nr:hypothetical protein [Deltaproteobacteria bacterium]